jgi:isoquinoline 1-oxidoreductase beta subunit
LIALKKPLENSMQVKWFKPVLPVNARAGNLTRRSFLKAGSVLGGGLVLGFFMPGADKFALAQPASTPSYAPNAFLRIAPDNSVTILVSRLEFGQGVNTSLPMMIAEELDADWSLVRSELAPAGEAYKDPNFGMQMTGGSSSVKHSYLQCREIGAKARAMLISAAAQQWNVQPEQCRAVKGVVFGPGDKKSSYGALAEAAMKLPVPDKVTLKDPGDFSIIGKPTPRLDARVKSSGRQEFGIDHREPDMKTVLVARPPVFGGRLVKFDAVKAKAIPGVIDVLEIATESGGSGLAVIASGYWPAKLGRDALVAEWDASAVGKVSSAQQLKEYQALARKPGAIARPADIRKLAAAPKKIDAEFSFPYLAHAPMEPLNCVVHLKDGACTVWAGSQFQTGDQNAIAQTADLKPSQVTLHTMMAGGGFGRRAIPNSHYIVEAVTVAKAYKASGKSGPLKVVWSREDDIKGGYYRPAHVHRAEIGMDEKGKVLAWNHTIVGQSIMKGTPFEEFMVKNGVDSTMTEGMREPYDLPMKLSVHTAVQNVPVLWWRSVGSTHTAFVMETLIDELAQAAKTDPVAYRKKLLGDSHPRHLAALELAVAKSGYGKVTLPAGRAWGVAMHESFDSVVAYVVEASVTKGVPRLHKVTGGVHCNRAVNPLSIEAQVQGAILMALGTTLPGAAITLKDGVVEQQNFGDYVVARMSDMPQVDVHIVASTDAPTGMGEPGLPPLAPAFANAIASLTGKRLRSLPFDLASA